MFVKEMNYGYDDVCTIPAKVTNVNSRSECNPFKEGMLPIFAAPMDSVINERNWKIFKENHIIPTIPRTVNIDMRNKLLNDGLWVAYSLSEFEKLINNYFKPENPVHVIVDMANGHMKKLLDTVKSAKTRYGNNLIIMTGNIANEYAYEEYCKAGVDYVRVSIGSGSVCTTSPTTSIHRGIVNLLDGIQRVKNEMLKYDGKGNWYFPYETETKIIADGGIKGYEDVIKALALGADYVMIGGLFGSLVESSALTYYYNEHEHIIDPLDKNVNITECDGIFDVIIDSDNGNDSNGFILYDLYKVTYGMASKRGQEAMFGEAKNVPEGKTSYRKCTTNVGTWSNVMIHALRSAMSYCDITDVSDFNASNVEVQLKSEGLKGSVNKL